MKIFNVAIIGAGLIGRKRAKALAKNANSKLVVVTDICRDKAEALAREFNVESEYDWVKTVARKDIEIVIVSTVNKFLSSISREALRNGKHVLCEKPLGRNTLESKDMLMRVKKNKRIILKTGFNHRFHPAIAQAKVLLDNNEVGALCFLRCRYGHGGRAGYEKEWRADKNLCGGGELLDQGVHVVDLFRWFAGDFNEVFGYISTYYWDMQVEDNAVAIFKNKNGIIATMHTSWTQWKNLFSFEVFGKEGYLIIEGLGGSYGKETLKIGKRQREGAPVEKIVEFDGEDVSWDKEWQEFISAIENNRQPLGNGLDGYQANKMIEAVYKSSSLRRIVKIK